MEEERKCDHSVWIEGEWGVQHSDDVEAVAGCDFGCCTDYRCTICGKTFRVEWPD